MALPGAGAAIEPDVRIRLSIDMISADIDSCRTTMPTRPTRGREYLYSTSDLMVLTATGLAMPVTPPPSPRVP